MRTLVTILLLVFTNFAFAAEFSIQATLDSYRVSVGEQFIFEVELVINGSSNAEMPVPTLPNLNNFAELVGSSEPESSSFSFVNGKTQRSVTKTYQLVYLAKKEGKYKIPTIHLNFEGRSYRTQPLELLVTKAATNQLDPTKNLFVKAETEKKEYYVNEQITVRYKIFTLLGISNIPNISIPDYVGVISEILEQPQRLTTKSINIKGKKFTTADIRTVALFPNKSGELRIEPVKVTCDVQVPSKRTRSRRRSLFDDDFFGGFNRTERRIVASNTLNLKIKPLPTKGKPVGFTGAVGRFKFTANLSANSANVGDAVSLNLRVEGSGNLKTLELPKVNIPAGVEVYDPETKDDIRKSSQNIYGNKEVHYILVPRRGGEIVIPSIKFSFFDPNKEEYITSETGDLVINVSGDASEGFGSSVPVGKQNVVSQGSDIRFIQSGITISDGGKLPSNFWLLNIIPVLLIGIAYIFVQVQQRNEANKDQIRVKKAGSVALKKLKKAKSLVDSGEPLEFYVELHRATLEYFALKVGVSEKGVVWEELKEKLESKKIESDLITQLEEILNTCNFARFAPGSDKHSEKENLLNKVVELITQTEKTI